jgi:hypothetical protein
MIVTHLSWFFHIFGVFVYRIYLSNESVYSGFLMSVGDIIEANNNC